MLTPFDPEETKAVTAGIAATKKRQEIFIVKLFENLMDVMEEDEAFMRSKLCLSVWSRHKKIGNTVQFRDSPRASF